MSTQPPSKDWSATQYLKFSNERTRPVHDLISQVAPHITTPNPQIYDLGCGPGNSTSALLSAFPGARITGVDSSADMLSKARTALPDHPFIQADLSSFSPTAHHASQPHTPPGSPTKIDLLFSNAVFHWLRTPARLTTLTTLFTSLSPGAVLAFQMPDNYLEPSHSLMRRVAALPNTPWTPFFAAAAVGDRSAKDRPDLDPIEPTAEYYNALAPHAQSVNMWHTTYLHVLADAEGIVEWVKGSGLMPFLQRMEGEEGVKAAFLEKYREALEREYPVMDDGRVVLRYPRLFVVAVRK